MIISPSSVIPERLGVPAAECAQACLTFKTAHSCNPPDSFILQLNASPVKYFAPFLWTIVNIQKTYYDGV